MDIASLRINVDSTSLKKAERDLGRIGREADHTERAVVKLGKNGSAAFSNMTAFIKQAAAAMIAMQSAQVITRMTDEYTKFNAQLKLATRTEEELGRARTRVLSISKEAQTSVSGMGVLYARVANSVRELGISEVQTNAITRSVALSLKVSGATATESASAILQLSQAFASGVLRGEEFNSVNEAAPRLMKALADGIGKPIGALRGMAEQGQLTTDVLAYALPKALQELEKEAESVHTISGAFQVARDNLMMFVGESATSSNAISVMTGAIGLLAENLNLITSAALGFLAVKFSSIIAGLIVKSHEWTAATLQASAAQAASRNAAIADATAKIELMTATKAGILVAREEMLAKLASANANLIAAAAQANAARSAGALSFAIAMLKEAELQSAAATKVRSAAIAELAILGTQQAKVTAAMTAAQVAQTAALTSTTAAATMASRALGLLGGPIGWITTALGLGVTAWLMWGKESKDASDTASDAMSKSTSEIVSNIDAQIEKLKERNNLAQIGLKDLVKNESEASTRLIELQKQYDNLQRTGSPTGGAALPESARVALLQVITKQIGELVGKQRELNGEQARFNAIGEQSKASQWLSKYATDAEKLAAELAKAKAELGAAFTPEIEKRIRDSFVKPTQDAVVAEKELTEAQRQSAEVIKLRNKLAEEAFEARERLRKSAQEYAAQELKAYTDSADSAQQSLQAMIDQEEAIGLSKSAQISLARAVELTTIARLKERQIAAMANTDAVMAIQREIDARMKAIKMMEGSEARQVLEDNEKAWKDSYQRISDSFVDAMIQGGDGIKTWLKNQFANLVLRPILAPIGGSVASLFGGSASAGTGGTMDTISGISNLYTGLTNSFATVGANVSSTLLKAGDWLATSSNNLMASGGEFLQSISQSAGPIASSVAGFAAGMAAKSLISGGYTVSSGMDKLQNVGIAVASFINPVFGAIAGAVAGVFNRAFGRKLKDFGVQGTFGGDAGFAGSQYQFLKGGWFRSDKTKTSALDPEIQAALAGQFNLIKTSVTNMGAALGLGAEALDGYTRKIKISTKGMTEAQVTEAWNKEFAAIGEDMAQRLLGTFETTTTSRFSALSSALIKGIFKNANLKLENTVTTWVAGPFIREGEKAIDALARLSSSIVAVNPILDTLGARMFEVSLAGADMASKLADAFGGLEAMGAATSAYYQAFYSEAERTATATRQLTAVLAGMGLALPQTRDQFRALVESQDLYTDAGRATYAALIQLAPAFDAITSAMRDASKTVMDEVRRLRGVTAGASLSSLQAQFAIASGAARAGDAGALSQLPELSKAIEDAARLTARSSVDLALTRAWLASSMTETLGVLGMDVPAFANGGAYGGGLAMVGERGPELINFDRPGMVYSEAQTSSLMGGNSEGDAALVSEMRQLRSEVTMLRSEARATALNTGKTTRLLERVSRDGESLQVTITDAP